MARSYRWLSRRFTSTVVRTLVVRTLACASLGTTFVVACPQLAADDGMPWLSAAGRYFGVGYSQRGYQSPQGRPAALVRNHPAANYPSSHLTHIYQPAYMAQPYVRPHVTGTPAVAPTLPPSAPAAPAIPATPPPKWLEQYLRDPNSDSLPNPMVEPLEDASPSDRYPSRSKASIPAEEIDLRENKTSPYESELLKDSSKPSLLGPGMDAANDLLNEVAPTSNDGDSLLEETGPNKNGGEGIGTESDDDLLKGTSDPDDLLGADARYKIQYSRPSVQATNHLYTPFR